MAAKKHNVDAAVISTVQDLFPELDADAIARTAKRCGCDIDATCDALLDQVVQLGRCDDDDDDYDDDDDDGDDGWKQKQKNGSSQRHSQAMSSP